MATWPQELPPFSANGYGEAPISQVIETSPSVGDPKSRMRTTAQYRKMDLTLDCEPGHVDIFEDWFRVERPNAVPFDIVHPRTGRNVRARITGDPPYNIALIQSGEAYQRITFSIYILP